MSDLELTGYDTDGDGIDDHAAGDTDGDGVDETFALDRDGDGTFEVMGVDTSGDGVVDVAQIDLDGDGVVDEVKYDEDYDGAIDRTESYEDSDPDLEGSSADTDGDGVEDTFVSDTDGDDMMDTFAYDTDGDGEIDAEHTVDDETEGLGGAFGGDEAEYHQAQAVSGQCGPTSFAMILSEHSGETVPYTEVVDRAVEMGLLEELPDGTYTGMFAQGMEELMESYGIETDVEYGDLESLETYLDEGRDIIVAVDAGELWGTHDSSFADHYLVVTEIDEDAGTVLLNDPGQADGASYEVPLEDFVDAWGEGGNEMLVTVDAGPDGVDGDTDTDTDTDEAFAIDDADGDATGSVLGGEVGAGVGSGGPGSEPGDAGFAILNVLVQVL